MLDALSARFAVLDGSGRILSGHGRLEFRPAGVAYELETPVARVLMAATPAP